MRQKYSYEFKEALVTQLLTRGDRTITSVCEETPMTGPALAENWAKNSGKPASAAMQKARISSMGEAAVTGEGAGTTVRWQVPVGT